jgi:hypothetical protein
MIVSLVEQPFTVAHKVGTLLEGSRYTIGAVAQSGRCTLAKSRMDSPRRRRRAALSVYRSLAIFEFRRKLFVLLGHHQLLRATCTAARQPLVYFRSQLSALGSAFQTSRG